MTRLLIYALAISLIGCAGRSPVPVAIVQDRDQAADCGALQREQGVNVATITRLREEQDLKEWQNAGAIGVGIFIWPALLAMDWQGAATQEIAALDQRNRHLGRLVMERCALKPA